MIASRRPTATKCTAPGRPKAPIRLTWNLFALFVAPPELPPAAPFRSPVSSPTTFTNLQKTYFASEIIFKLQPTHGFL